MQAQKTFARPQPQRLGKAARSVSRRGAVQVVATGTLKAIIAGAPASGKGTQCAKIVEEYNLVHISVGDLLRDEVKRGSAIGKKAKSFMDQGLLVPDEVVVDMVTERLAGSDVARKGWLLDGYPRSATQAEAIEKVGIRPDVFLVLDVPDAMLMERVTGRRMDPKTGQIYHIKFKPAPVNVAPRLIQRSDDSESKMKVRLEQHNANTAAVQAYYKDIAVTIDGNQDMDAVFSAVQKALQVTLARIDPLEAMCAENPDADECRVYTD